MIKSQQAQWASHGFPEYHFSETCHMGVNTIAKLLPALFHNAGIGDWDWNTGHCLHQYGITKLANSGYINHAEVAWAAQHGSTESQQAYIAVNHHSEVACAWAMMEDQLPHQLPVQPQQVAAQLAQFIDGKPSTMVNPY